MSEKNLWNDYLNVADQFWASKPWQTFADCDLIGIQNPEDESETAFVQVLGQEGLDCSIIIYPTPQATQHVVSIMTNPYACMDELLEIPQVHTTFEDVENLTPDNLALLEKIEREIPPIGHTTVVNQMGDGRIPVQFTNVKKLTFYKTILEQMLAVAAEYPDQSEVRVEEMINKNCYPVRVQHPDGWKTHSRIFTPYTPPTIEATFDPDLVKRLGGYTERGKLEITLNRLSPVELEDNSTPVFSYLLLAVDPESGSIAGYDMICPENGPEQMLGEILGKTVEILHEAERFPEEIMVNNLRLAMLLKPLDELLDLELSITEELPISDAVVQLMRNMGQI